MSKKIYENQTSDDVRIASSGLQLLHFSYALPAESHSNQHLTRTRLRHVFTNN